MAEHTPGPWLADDYGRILTDDGNTVVASVADDEGRFADDLAESNANARLLATAPELLAAMKALFDVADIGDEGPFDAAMALAAAAIRKAEGL